MWKFFFFFFFLFGLLVFIMQSAYLHHHPGSCVGTLLPGQWLTGQTETERLKDGCLCKLSDDKWNICPSRYGPDGRCDAVVCWGGIER